MPANPLDFAFDFGREALFVFIAAPFIPTCPTQQPRLHHLPPVRHGVVFSRFSNHRTIQFTCPATDACPCHHGFVAVVAGAVAGVTFSGSLSSVTLCPISGSIVSAYRFPNSR